MSAESAELEDRLIERVASYSRDPLGFVRFAFPWGEPGPLEFYELDPWQEDLLRQVGDGLISSQEAVRIAVASGHGIGKSALVAWLVLWAICTKPDTRGVVTAGTEGQLRTKTWPELSKWHRLLICRHWFKCTATAIYSVEPAREKTWRIDAIPWSETNPEAFAGLHNQGRRILVVVDEASQVAELIFDTIEGALTDADTEIIWAVFGNPTRNSGRFHAIFGALKHRWITRQIDSRSVSITNKEQVAQWVTDYGEDSDFVRVRVRGVFPKAGNMQFIASNLAEEAAARMVEQQRYAHEPLILGVDVARFGDDETVIALRRGRDARSIQWVTMRGADTMQVASRVVEVMQRNGGEIAFVDEGGLGAGVVDRLRQLRVSVMGVNFGSKPSRSDLGDKIKAANKRAEMWAFMREWLAGGAIPHNLDLIAELTGLEYGFDANGAVQLERKADMKRRGLASPDRGDALALTFAHPVMAQSPYDEGDDDDDYRQWSNQRSATGY